jgi:hypothetical protein
VLHRFYPVPIISAMHRRNMIVDRFKAWRGTAVSNNE